MIEKKKDSVGPAETGRILGEALADVPEKMRRPESPD